MTLQVRHSDPLRCPVCQNPMRVIAIIEDRRLVEKILRHLGLWRGPPPGTGGFPGPHPGPWTYHRFDDADPLPDYENVLTDYSEFSNPGAANVSLRHLVHGK